MAREVISGYFVVLVGFGLAHREPFPMAVLSNYAWQDTVLAKVTSAAGLERGATFSIVSAEFFPCSMQFRERHSHNRKDSFSGHWQVMASQYTTIISSDKSHHPSALITTKKEYLKHQTCFVENGSGGLALENQDYFQSRGSHFRCDRRLMSSFLPSD